MKKWNHCKNGLDTLYNHIVNDIKIRSKCECYEHGKKSTKFFLNLEKKCGIQNRAWELNVKEKELNDPKEISNNIKVFYETLLKQNCAKTDVEKFLTSLDIKTLKKNNSQVYVKMKYGKLIYLILWKVWKTVKHLVMMD